jgi:hypothetical protein
VNPRVVELALRKQRLQMRCEVQRRELERGLRCIDGILDAVDHLRDGARWLRGHAPTVSAAVLVLLVWRPRFTLRWLRRGWLGLSMYHRARAALAGLARSV